MTISTEKSIQLEDPKHATELLVDKFYTLRKAFEAAYSGHLRSHKYEETRAFTIALNHAIFQANQLAFKKSISFRNLQELKTKLDTLKQNYRYLTQ